MLSTCATSGCDQWVRPAGAISARVRNKRPEAACAVSACALGALLDACLRQLLRVCSYAVPSCAAGAAIF